jgi:hypothetical protein
MIQLTSLMVPQSSSWIDHASRTTKKYRGDWRQRRAVQRWPNRGVEIVVSANVETGATWVGYATPPVTTRQHGWSGRSRPCSSSLPLEVCVRWTACCIRQHVASVFQMRKSCVQRFDRRKIDHSAQINCLGPLRNCCYWFKVKTALNVSALMNLFALVSVQCFVLGGGAVQKKKNCFCCPALVRKRKGMT